MGQKLVSMKIDAAEREKNYNTTVAADAPQYPWGLGLTLDNEAIEKLGLDLPKVDSEMMLSARVTVTGVSSSASTGSGKRQSVNLQITALCLEKSGKGKDAGETLYDGEQA